MFTLVLAESALELVPKGMWTHPAVVSDSRRRGKEPREILLDRSFHHSAMARLEGAEKRGRPDITHVALLSATGTPLYLEGRMKVYVHTCQDMVLDIAEKTRIPKSYFRFRGLMEKALAGEEEEGLVKSRPSELRELVVKRIGADAVYGLSVQGKSRELDEFAASIVEAERPCALVGGFPRGHFRPETTGLADELVRIDPTPLEAHVVVARLVYEVEKASKGINR